jgi:photosystem II stability/assembly factor-like uncharacterized protein
MKARFFSSFLFTVLLAITPRASEAQWVQTMEPLGGRVTSLASSGTNLFAGTQSGTIFRSNDSGMSWVTVDSGLTGKSVWCFLERSHTLFAGTLGGGALRSTNHGATWDKIDSGLSNIDVRSLAAVETTIYAGTSLGVYRSTNFGESWTATGPVHSVYSLCTLGSYLFAGCDFVYRSTNSGASWTGSSTFPVYSVISIAAVGSAILAGTSYDGCHVSKDSGASWSAANSGLPGPFDGLNGPTITFIVSLGAHVFVGNVGMNGPGVYHSTNNGLNWTRVNDGLGDLDVYSAVINGPYLYVGARGIWRRPLSDFITSVQQPSSQAPITFSMSQNYPNPFNPSTTIQYGLPARTHITLKVFNTLGQHVTTLVQGEQEAGYHEVRFDGTGLASGIYFYRLTAGSFVETKKLLLLR